MQQFCITGFKQLVCSQLEKTTLDRVQIKQQQHHIEKATREMLVFASSWEFEF